jgi:hypothetical protein
MAESFVDAFKTELIADRVWRTRTQLELAIVEWVGWYNARPARRAGRHPARRVRARARPRRPLRSERAGRWPLRRRPPGSGSPASVRPCPYCPSRQITRSPRNPVRLTRTRVRTLANDAS